MRNEAMARNMPHSAVSPDPVPGAVRVARHQAFGSANPTFGTAEVDPLHRQQMNDAPPMAIHRP